MAFDDVFLDWTVMPGKMFAGFESFHLKVAEDVFPVS